MASKPVLTVLILLGVLTWVGTVSHAGEALLFDFPRSYTPQPSSFLLTYRNANDPGGVLQQMGIPWHPLAACASFTTGGQPEPDMFCATLPSCLAPGLYTFWAQAVWPNQRSDKSELFTCQATSGCQCTVVATSAPPSTTPPGAPVTTPPPQSAPVTPPAAPTPPAIPPATPAPIQQPVFHLPPSAPA